MKHKVVIDRAKWVNGTNKHNQLNLSSMRNEQGNMCCLGHAVKQIYGLDGYLIPTPMRVFDYYAKAPDELFVVGNSSCLINSEFSSIAMELNDEPIGEDYDVSSQEDREQKLIALFAENDIELSFVGELFKLEKPTNKSLC